MYVCPCGQVIYISRGHLLPSCLGWLMNFAGFRTPKQASINAFCIFLLQRYHYFFSHANTHPIFSYVLEHSLLPIYIVFSPPSTSRDSINTISTRTTQTHVHARSYLYPILSLSYLSFFPISYPFISFPTPFPIPTPTTSPKNSFSQHHPNRKKHPARDFPKYPPKYTFHINTI